MNNIFSRMWRGETNLVPAFWGWLVLGGAAGWSVFWGAFFESLNGKYGFFYNSIVYVAHNFGSSYAYFLAYCFIFLNAAYCAFTCRGVCIAAYKYEKNKAWKYLAMISVAGYIVSTAQNLWKVIASL